MKTYGDEVVRMYFRIISHKEFGDLTYDFEPCRVGPNGGRGERSGALIYLPTLPRKSKKRKLKRENVNKKGRV